MKTRFGIFLGALLLLASLLASCKTTPTIDPAKVDPQHYKVEFENDQFRLLHVTVGPHEKSPMHDHPRTMVLVLHGGKTRITTEDGKFSDPDGITPSVGESPAGRHSFENLDDKTYENYIIEFKK